VILAAGSFNTPQILQLSGVGPPDLLARHGIEVMVPLPGVGENLQDRYEATVVQRMREPFSMLEGSTMVPPGPGEEPDAQFRDWLDGRGVYTTNGAVMSVIRRSTPEAPDPDLFLFALVTDFRGYYPGYSERVRAARRFLTWAVLKGFTHNHAGRVAIRSADPRDTPQIDFHYFEEGSPGGDADLDAVVGGLEFVRELSAGYGHRVECEEVPGPDVRTRDDLRRYVRDQAWGHHASGTCKIGRPDDPMAVLDSRFRVRGTQGLRVVDASVFPRIPGLFIVSAVYMIGEKASDVILEDAAGNPTPAREREP
jgi:choline dehydrogenase